MKQQQEETTTRRIQESTYLRWEQKLQAMQALTDVSLRMRAPGDWYVSAVGRNIGGDGMLTGAYGNGKTPEEAVADDWRQLVEFLPADRYLVIERAGVARKRVRWNGFMWGEVPSGTIQEKI